MSENHLENMRYKKMYKNVRREQWLSKKGGDGDGPPWAALLGWQNLTQALRFGEEENILRFQKKGRQKFLAEYMQENLKGGRQI